MPPAINATKCKKGKNKKKAWQQHVVAGVFPGDGQGEDPSRQRDGSQQRHDRGAKQNRSQTRAGRVGATAGHRWQLERRQDEGISSRRCQQQLGFGFFPHQAIDTPGAGDDERQRNRRPRGGVQRW